MQILVWGLRLIFFWPYLLGWMAQHPGLILNFPKDLLISFASLRDLRAHTQTPYIIELKKMAHL